MWSCTVVKAMNSYLATNGTKLICAYVKWTHAQRSMARVSSIIIVMALQ